MTTGAEGGGLAEQLRSLDEQVSDLARVIARQAQTIERLVDADAKRAAAATADLPLLVELLALYSDAAACAEGADGETDRAAFTALRDGLDRLIAGRGGLVVVPRVGDAFDVATMDAVDTVPTEGDAQSRTVAQLLRPGLRVGERSVRPAAVVVYR